MEDQLFKEKSFIELKIDQLNKSIALAKKDLKIYYNKGPVIIQGILFPIMLFLAFTIGRKIMPIYIISGLIAMVLFLTSTSIGPVVFPWETRLKTLERLISCPVSIKTILLGNVLSSFLYGCLFSLVPLFIGIICYKMWNTMNFFILSSGILLAAFSFSSFSLILSTPPTDNPSSTMTLTVLIKFPVIFISPLFIDIQPKIIYLVSPLTYLLDILNTGLGEFSIFGKYGLLIDYGILLIFGLLFFHLSAFLHKKSVIKRLR
jgi:ABC-2 type transport system permease protein